MKFNWGTGIALFYSVFVIVLVFAVIRSTGYDNSLVSDHYYADDINYQQHYDKVRNSQLLEKDLRIYNFPQKEVVALQFPENLGAVGGEIYFFCPSDSRQDFRIPVKLSENFQQEVATTDLKPGLWRVKVSWEAGDREFYKEEVIQI